MIAARAQPPLVCATVNSHLTFKIAVGGCFLHVRRLTNRGATGTDGAVQATVRPLGAIMERNADGSSRAMEQENDRWAEGAVAQKGRGHHGVVLRRKRPGEPKWVEPAR